MNSNSQLTPIDTPVDLCGGYSSPVLLYESAVSRLYRVSKAGKHFIVKTAADNSERLRALIRREYEISIDLNHPYLINVFTYEDNTPVGEGIIMEYVDGRNLRDFLSENPSATLRRRVLGQLLDAVSYLHRKGIIHNDLKPENILVTRMDNTVKLIDFGLSDNDAFYLSKTLGCTPRYASPELLARQNPDSRSDVYSLGLLIGEMFGRRYKSVSLKATALKRDRRYANVDALRAALSRRGRLMYVAVFLLVAMFIIGSLYIRQKNTLDVYKRTELEEKSFRDSIYNDIELRIDAILMTLEQRLAEIQYQEQALEELARSSERLMLIPQSLQTVTDDKAMIDDFLEHYSVQYNLRISRIIEIVNSKPSR